MRKLFPCGHKGKGKFCNRCKLEKARLDKELQQRSSRKDIYAMIGKKDGEIPRRIAEKAAPVWKSIEQTKKLRNIEGLRPLNGGKLKGHYVVSLGKRWRLLAKIEAGIAMPVSVLSHAEYNQFLTQKVSG